MPAGKTLKAKPKERKRWLETLLDRMSAPAAVMRQHLEEEDQAHTLGSAAEKGVRDLLRLVLPQRLAVTSGFLREPGRSLAGITPAGTLSPQTDVIVYDSSDAIPLLSLGEIDIVAAPDALGVIEVKDTKKGSVDLASARGEGGALEHTARLGALAPNAFRAIVLFRGKERATAEEDESGEEDQPEETQGTEGKNKVGRPALSELATAKNRLLKAELAHDQVPHVIYCASYAIDEGKDGSYLACYDFRAQTMHIHEYHGDQTRALASFLRIITGFFAVRGLISPSLHLDLLPTKPDGGETVENATTSFDGLHERLLKRRGESGSGTRPFYGLLVELLRNANNAVSKVATGHDAAGLPTAGIVISVELTIREEGMDPVRMTSVAFFYLAAPNVFVCTDASADEAQRWTIEDETVEEYRRRALRESGRADADNVAPGKRLETEREN
ncbi:DUF6602 domain-containing protein [Sorangium sp. So ce260]|uniref:DUF6602 domain-containing protein n=1 Tax=Sorangium sp. So ce260 TaxID=3133291 RepID=UPI003F62F8EF